MLGMTDSGPKASVLQWTEIAVAFCWAFKILKRRYRPTWRDRERERRIDIDVDVDIDIGIDTDTDIDTDRI